MKLSPEKLASLQQMVAENHGDMKVNGVSLFTTERKKGQLVGVLTRAGKKSIAESQDN
jgi:hypothetical protein